MRILLIEDEFGIGDGMRAYLARMGRRVDWVRSFREGTTALMTQAYDILLVDLRLPDGDGLDLVNQLRNAGDKRPIIIISAQDQIRDRIKGLNAGADDYIVKPFNLGEMEARIHAIERRTFGNPNPKLTIGNVAIDATNRRVWVNDEEQFLTKSEWAMLQRLCRQPGVAVPKAELEEVLSELNASIDSNAIEVYVSRLRRKLGAHVILTARRIGYRVAV